MREPLKQPRVSIIIPAYNTESYIAECINSVLVQTYKNLEVIVVDDGSTDGTADIARAIAETDKRVEVISQQNSGQGGARNTGLRKASGEIIFFLDSDDYFSPDIVEQAVAAMLHNNCDVVVFNGTSFFDEDGVITLKGDRYFALVSKDAQTAFTGLQILSRTGGRIVQPCMKAYGKAFLEVNGILFPEDIYGEDTIFLYDVFVKAEKVIYVDECGYNRRYRKNSAMTGTGIRNISDRISSFHLLEQSREAIDSAADKKTIASQHMMYACLIWLLIMIRRDKAQRNELLGLYRANGIFKLLKENRGGFVVSVFRIVILLPSFFEPVQRLFAGAVKLMGRKVIRF